MPTKNTPNAAALLEQARAEAAEPPSMVDQLADDVAEPDYPPGCPVLLPVLQVRPRSRRADLKRRYGDLVKMQDKLSAMRTEMNERDPDSPSPEDGARQIKLWADLDDMYQVMDDLLVLAAADPEVYRKWSDTLTDDNLLAQAFSVYVRRSQLGEVSSSTS